MTTTPDPGYPAPAPAPSGFFVWLRSLGIVRPDGSWAAGVASGFARRIGVDVAIVRGVLILLALFGGFGLLLYGLAWAMLPNERGEIALQEAIAGRWSSGMTGALIVVILGFGGGSFPFLNFFPRISDFGGGLFSVIAFLAIVGVVIWALVARSGRKRDEARARAGVDPMTGAPTGYGTWPAAPGTPGAPAAPGTAGFAAWPAAPGTTPTAAYPQTTAATEAFPAPAATAPYAPETKDSTVTEPDTADSDTSATAPGSTDQTATEVISGDPTAEVAAPDTDASDHTATEVIAESDPATAGTALTVSMDGATVPHTLPNSPAVAADAEPTVPFYPATPETTVPAYAASTTPAAAYTQAPGYGGYDGYAGSGGGQYPPYGGGAYGGTPAAPVPPAAPRPTSRLANLITIGSVLVAVGLILGIDRLTDLRGDWNLHLPVAATCVAIALAILAIGIIVQGLRGRGAVLLSILAIFGVITVAAGNMGPYPLFSGSTEYWSESFSSSGSSSGGSAIVAGDQTFVPTTADEAASGFDITASDATVDLTAITDLGPDTIHVPITVTVSDLDVILPADATARIITRSGLSSIDVSDDFAQVAEETSSGSGSHVFRIGEGQPDFIVEISGTASDISIDTNR